jgi:hypothetical protein
MPYKGLRWALTAPSSNAKSIGMLTVMDSSSLLNNNFNCKNFVLLQGLKKISSLFKI